ncbi:MAG: hypothetical protein ACTHKU_16575, partial [Verrucomicrobiota bacterium]
AAGERRRAFFNGLAAAFGLSATFWLPDSVDIAPVCFATLWLFGDFHPAILGLAVHSVEGFEMSRHFLVSEQHFKTAVTCQFEDTTARLRPQSQAHDRVRMLRESSGAVAFHNNLYKAVVGFKTKAFLGV